VQASKSLGFTNFFQNFLTIAVLLTAWIIVIISFFILAVQLFITILEFKLTGWRASSWCPLPCGTAPTSWPSACWAMW
jgi:type IV secretory pathway TrbL component